MADQETPVPTRVECPAAVDPLIRSLIATLMCLGFGLYSIYELATGTRTLANDDASTYWFTVVCAAALTPIGLLLLALAIRKGTRRLIADDEGIGYARGEKIAWDRVTKLVARGKGLVDVHYGDDDDVLNLDSWKLKNFDDLIALLEAKTEGKPVEEAKAK